MVRQPTVHLEQQPSHVYRQVTTAQKNGSWLTSQEPSALEYAPILSDEYGFLFFEAAYDVAFLPLDAQATRLNNAVTRNQVLLERAKVDGRRENYADLARNVAALLLLRDLLQIGWRMTLYGTKIQLFQPHLDADVKVAKQQIRDSMSQERRESIEAKPVRDFIRFMERPRLFDDKICNILSLMADGPKLHGLLEKAAGRASKDRAGYLRRVIRPYLQAVGTERDAFTGYRLYDIWRYFRLTWSTPNRSVPGRNIFYLVRDAGQPYHPIIGIAALANCVIGLRCRDDRIGWTADALGDRLRVAKEEGTEAFKQTAWEIAGLLEGHLRRGLSEIALEGIATRNTLAHPTVEDIAAIEALAATAHEERYGHLQLEAQTEEDMGLELAGPDEPFAEDNIARSPGDSTERDSSKALFRRKRAAKLARLLQAKLLVQQLDVFENAPIGLPLLLWNDADWSSQSDKGRSALRTILNANKETKVGTSMMEIVVCGAVAPYNHLLGGKLVAMLLTSPEVVEDYKARYEERASTIASQVAGYDVTRPAQLVYLGTSSLYAGASDRTKYSKDKKATIVPSSASQYNRIQVPADVFGGHGAVRYDCIGMTEGFGVVHFSSETRVALEQLDVILHNAKRVNSVFGEGTSPRMRKIRQGISILGLDDRFLIHGQSRLVYAINLAHNTSDYLMGKHDTPDYILTTKKPKSSSKKIAQHWINRWLSSRINYAPALEAVRGFIPRDGAISREFFQNEAQRRLDL